MSQDSFLTIAVGFLLGVLVTVAAGGAVLQVRLVAERERVERAEQEAEQERERADELEDQARMLRLEAERAAREKPTPPVRPEPEPKATAEDDKLARQKFWELVEQERKKKQVVLPPPSVPGNTRPRP